MQAAATETRLTRQRASGPGCARVHNDERSRGQGRSGDQGGAHVQSNTTYATAEATTNGSTNEATPIPERRLQPSPHGCIAEQTRRTLLPLPGVRAALDVCVRVRCLDGRADDLDLLASRRASRRMGTSRRGRGSGTALSLSVVELHQQVTRLRGLVSGLSSFGEDDRRRSGGRSLEVATRSHRRRSHHSTSPPRGCSCAGLERAAVLIALSAEVEPPVEAGSWAGLHRSRGHLRCARGWREHWRMNRSNAATSAAMQGILLTSPLIPKPRALVRFRPGALPL